MDAAHMCAQRDAHMFAVSPFATMATEKRAVSNGEIMYACHFYPTSATPPPLPHLHYPTSPPPPPHLPTSPPPHLHTSTSSPPHLHYPTSPPLLPQMRRRHNLSERELNAIAQMRGGMNTWLRLSSQEQSRRSTHARTDGGAADAIAAARAARAARARAAGAGASGSAGAGASGSAGAGSSGSTGAGSSGSAGAGSSGSAGAGPSGSAGAGASGSAPGDPDRIHLSRNSRKRPIDV